MTTVLGSRIWALPANLRDRVQAAELIALDTALQVVHLEATTDELEDARQRLADARQHALRYLRETEDWERIDFSPRDAVPARH